MQCGRPHTYPDGPGGAPWQSALGRAVVEQSHVGALGLDGDEVADTEHHGGADKAVFAYPLAHYPRWAEDLGPGRLAVGAMGENLVVEALDEDGVCIGDTVRIGTVTLQVSQPRRPCWKPGRLAGVDDLQRRTIATGRTGWYYRVLAPGVLRRGDTLELMTRPHPSWTVARANAVIHHGEGGPGALDELISLGELSAKWRHGGLRRTG